MSKPQSIQETMLWQKAMEFVEQLHFFTNNLQNSETDLYGIPNKLRSSVSEIPMYIEESYNVNNKLMQGKNIFLADMTLDECIRVLSQVQVMNLGETTGLIKSAQNIKEHLSGYSYRGYNKPA